MARAKREGGLYYTVQGVAVDAEGRKVEGAPKAPADTDPSKQPGAGGAGSPAAVTMRLDEDSIRALGGKPAKESKADAKARAAAADEDAQEPDPNAPPDPFNRVPAETAPDVKSQQPGEGGTEPSGSARGSARKGGARKGGARKSTRKSAGGK